MNPGASKETVRPPFFTPGVYVLFALMGAGLYFAFFRYFYGLHSVTNLSDMFPWGIWKAVNVAAVAALGSSGFTLTAIVHIFHREQYHKLMRPSLVVALLCYSFVGVALLVDIGKYYDIWHPMMPWMWQPNSALFEVAMCVMCYLTVLFIEFAPIAFERFIGQVRLPGPLAVFNGLVDGLLRIGDTVLGRVMSLFMILGIVLCCLHQSTLGTLMVIPMYKMHPLWFTPTLPLLFLLSAAAVGLASALLVSLWSSKAFGVPYERDALASLAVSVPLVTGAYLAVRIIDLALHDHLGAMFDGSPRATMFLVEILAGFALPSVLLLFDNVRRSPRLLSFCAVMLILGVSFNRINTYLTAYVPFHANGRYYFPAIGEIAICVAQVAAIIFLYRLIVYVFPIFEEHPAAEPAPVSTPAQAVRNA